MGDMTRRYHFTSQMVKRAYGKYNGKRESSENTYEMRKRNTALDCLPVFCLSLQSQSCILHYCNLYVSFCRWRHRHV